ncbi:hypothetical protein [Muricomes intestini]|uniref:hypothetical protein n=1 Tax=Muricomes intestini TaxID=1796634 RepID=UPI002FE2C44C
MLDEKDLQAIAELIDTRAEKTENLLLDEIGRTQSYLEKQIAEVKKNVDELNQYYRITRLENDNTALLLKMIESLQKDVEELKKKTA